MAAITPLLQWVARSRSFRPRRRPIRGPRARRRPIRGPRARRQPLPPHQRSSSADSTHTVSSAHSSFSPIKWPTGRQQRGVVDEFSVSDSPQSRDSKRSGQVVADFVVGTAAGGCGRRSSTDRTEQVAAVSSREQFGFV
ncbi:hypothetical protein AXF42_Ash013852 [Apostasia shenzhenica]|uniref:Uncharacterized protein n=1 Tax=Apostasia shenzhenica TaxID=1088818 RepID=A0A2I0AS91_9ASPA|nr:hypothetical protein AXF42_Ash013852 [Apostasia shenzhenica]